MYVFFLKIEGGVLYQPVRIRVHLLLMRLLSIISCLTFSLSLCAQMPELEWSGHFNGENIVKVFDITSTSNGVIVVGEFRDVVDLDPGIGVVEFTTPPVLAQMPFILLLDDDMNLIWAKHLQAYVSSTGRPNIISDLDGYTYYSCMLGANTDIDPGPSEVFVNASSDAVILKLDPDGNILWAKVLGDGNFWDTRTNDITLDPEGNIITTGYFSGVADFDPGPDTLLMDSDHGRGFIHKMDNDGNLLWTGQFAGNGIFNEGQAVETDADGNIYVAGIYTYPSDFDIGPDTVWVEDNSGRDAFVMKYSAEGELIWVNSFAGPGEDWPYGIEVLENGGVVCTGRFEDTLDFDPGPNVYELVSAGFTDAFVLRLTTDGELDWVRTFGAINFENAVDVVKDDYGNLHLVGSFYHTVDFDPGPDEFILSISDSTESNGFILTLDSLGNFVWAGQIGAGAGAVAIDAENNLYCVGSFGNTIDLDPSPSEETLYTSAGQTDAFVLKLNMDSLLTSLQEETEQTGNLSVAVYPNPSNGIYKVILGENTDVRYEIRDIRGRVVQAETFVPAKGSGAVFNINLQGESGIYFLEVVSDSERSVIKLVKE